MYKYIIYNKTTGKVYYETNNLTVAITSHIAYENEYGKDVIMKENETF